MYSETFPRVKVVLLTFRSWEGGRIKEAVRRKGGGNVKDEGGKRKEEGGKRGGGGVCAGGRCGCGGGGARCGGAPIGAVYTSRYVGR